jgi:hypothetical protein
MSETAIALVAGLGGAIIGALAAIGAQALAIRAQTKAETTRWTRE